MTNPGASGGKIFRPSAARLFLFLVGLELPLFVCIMLARYGTSLHWRELLLGAALIVPLAIIFAGVASSMLPWRLTPEGIHAHNAWGLPRFIRWRDIQSARKFNFLILPWLRLYPSDGSTVVWLIMFPAAPAQFKLEIQRLAPPGNPILNHLE
jgi:hypothetical protein